MRATNGGVRLVKLNIDENPEIAQHLRVQSIPAVFAFVDGKPVDGFVGALPESQVKTFIGQLTAAAGPSPVEQALEQARAAFAAGETAAAANIFAQIIAHDQTNIVAHAGLARCALASGDLAGARQALAGLPEEADKDPEVTAARTALELAEQGESAGDTDELVARLGRDESDHEARYELALAHYAAGRAEAAIEALLEIVRRDREWNDEAARKQLVKIFEALGPADLLTLAGRRQLSSMLFS